MRTFTVDRTKCRLVLIVDDDPMMQWSIAGALRRVVRDVPRASKALSLLAAQARFERLLIQGDRFRRASAADRFAASVLTVLSPRSSCSPAAPARIVGSARSYAPTLRAAGAACLDRPRPARSAVRERAKGTNSKAVALIASSTVG